MFPFTLDGTQFLLLYGVLSALGLAVLTWRVHRRAESLRPSRREHGDPDAYEIAWLKGGARGTVVAALAALLAKGVVEQRGKRLEPNRAAGDTRQLHRVEREVLRHLPKGIPAALRGLATAPLHLERALSDRGLLRPTRSIAEAAPEVFPIVGGLLALGAARCVQGLSKDRPIGFLVAEMLVVALIGWLVTVTFTRSKRTAAGDALLAKLRATTPRDLHKASDDASGGFDPALPVALFGTSVLVGTQYADLHDRTRRDLGAAQYGSASSCGAGDIGAGSDGGGGGCGGGGGGCGGCGG